MKRFEPIKEYKDADFSKDIKNGILVLKGAMARLNVDGMNSLSYKMLKKLPKDYLYTMMYIGNKRFSNHVYYIRYGAFFLDLYERDTEYET